MDVRKFEDWAEQILAGSNIGAIRVRLSRADEAVHVVMENLQRLMKIASNHTDPEEIREIALKEGLLPTSHG